jgi:hypothetical protein
MAGGEIVAAPRGRTLRAWVPLDKIAQFRKKKKAAVASIGASSRWASDYRGTVRMLSLVTLKIPSPAWAARSLYSIRYVDGCFFSAGAFC